MDLSIKVEDYKLNGVIGLKRVETTYMVIPTTETENVISYRNQNWKRVEAYVETKVDPKSVGVSKGATVVPVESLSLIKVGSRLRINNTYEGTVQSISGLYVTLDTAAPEDIVPGSPVLGGAIVEGAKYVYVECHLDYDKFPLEPYRQIGLCSGVTPSSVDILLDPELAAKYSGTVYDSLGILEILDNRIVAHRDINQREMLSLIIEF